MNNDIHHPSHYTAYRPEVIEITRHLPFCLGNVVKYVLRAPYKDKAKDIEKALQYLDWSDDQPIVMQPKDAQSLLFAIDDLSVFLRSNTVGCGVLLDKFITRLRSVLYVGAPVAILRPIIIDLHECMSAVPGRGQCESA